MADTVVDSMLNDEERAQRDRLLALRAQLLQERDNACTPAVGRALELADTYLFIGLSGLALTDPLFPEQGRE